MGQKIRKVRSAKRRRNDETIEAKGYDPSGWNNRGASSAARAIRQTDRLEEINRQADAMTARAEEVLEDEPDPEML